MAATGTRWRPFSCRGRKPAASLRTLTRHRREASGNARAGHGRTGVRRAPMRDRRPQAAPDRSAPRRPPTRPEAELRKAELVTEIAEREGELEDVMVDIEDATDRLECLRQRADGVARDVEELRPVAAEVRRWEAAGKAERGAILDSIAARCAGAARAIGRAVEELGDRIWALMRPRKLQRTERSLVDVMREATEVARAAEALSRNHVAPTDSRSRGQAR